MFSFFLTCLWGSTKNPSRSQTFLKNFILTPGDGGQSRGYYGGGGGGVTVNGKMPDVTSEFAGAGFGGGSALDWTGYQGCVIVEI